MAWRLDKIIVNNFKVFPIEQKLDLNGKNVLLYGENGSGKSSFFWALYTLYLSRYKDSTLKVKKYFERNNDENLLNRYTSVEDSSIKALYHDEDTNSDKTISLSNDDQSIVGKRDPFIEATTTFSDFLNYHKQTSLFDYCNSEENDVFPSFARDIFPFISFSHKCTRLDGTLTESELASDWWDYINSAVLNEFKQADGNFLQSGDQKYQDFQTILDGFNTYLKTALQAIKVRADSILHDNHKLNLPNVELNFDYHDTTYNTSSPGNGVTDHILHNGRIIVTAVDLNIANPVARIIKRPRTYFNEATLSKIALAIRLAVFEYKAGFIATDGSKLLFIDDLLISFDMANRMEVAEYLLSYASSYQLIIFTHDKAFYNLLGTYITDRSEWKFMEIYMDNITLAGNKVPKPCICDKQSNMDKADECYTLGENIGCAVYLRKEIEHISKYIMEQRFLDNEDIITGKKYSKDLAELLSQLPVALAEYGITYSNQKLQVLRSNVLNVSAHDSADMPIYRTELQKAKEEVSKLSSYKRFVICSNNELGTKKFNFRLEKGGETISITFVYCQTASRITDVTGKNYYQNNNVQIKRIKKNGILVWDFVRIGGIYRLHDLYSRICHQIGVIEDIDNDIKTSTGNIKIKDII